MDKKKEHVVSVIRAVLISYKGAATLKKLIGDYRELEGDAIPYANLGYRSLEEFLKDISDIKLYKDSYGEVKVDAVPTESTRHIADMVARQKSVVRKYAPRANNQFHTFKHDSWKKPTSNGYRSQLYKQATPYRPHRNNNSSYTSNHNFNSYKPTQSTYKQAYRPNEVPKKLSPDRPETWPARRVVKTAPPTSTPLVASAAAPDVSAAAATAPAARAATSAAPKAKTPSTARKNSELTLSARLEAAILADEADSAPPAGAAQRVKHTRALGRMSSLRDSLATDVIPLPLPAARDAAPPLAPVPPPAPAQVVRAPAVVASARLPDPPPSSASAKEKLAWMCLKLNLPEPNYKMSAIKEKKGPQYHYCVAKVGTSYSAMTYPSEPAESPAGACEQAALKLLLELEGSGSGGLATSEPQLALARLVTLVNAHECGLWASTVPHIYRENFNENLPGNWQDLVENSSQYTTERGANGQLVILPKTSIPVALPEVASVLAPWVGGESAPAELPQLQLPAEHDWNVFITSVNTTIEVWLRLIGPEYSEAYHTLLEEMEGYYNSGSAPVTAVELNAWYAVGLEEGWLRALAVEVEGDQVLVFLGDHGDEELVPMASLRPLAPQFTQLSAQAILCRLDGMEELGGSTFAAHAAGKRLVGEVLVAVPGPPAADEPSLPVTLYRTAAGEEDVNVAHEILADVCEHHQIHITEELRGVEVGCVSTEGAVWLVSREGAALVQTALEMLTSPGPYYRAPPTSPPPHRATPKQNEMYMVRAQSGEWLRCTLRSGVAEDGSVSTRLVDSGQTMRAPFLDLKLLANYSEVLERFPHQARVVGLGSASRAAPHAVARLRELLLGAASVLCRALPPPFSSPPTDTHVELFVHMPHGNLISVNSTILYEYEQQAAVSKTKEESKDNPLEALSRKKERIYRSTSGGARAAPASGPPAPLPPLALPLLDQWVNVFITMAANPWNFVVQLTNIAERKRFMDMMAALQSECPKLSAADHPAQPSNGDLYTLFYENHSWYRVVVANVVSGDMLSVYFCDFGDLALVTAAELRRVPDTVPDARLLPPQAIKAKLHGVAPPHQDWSVEDCVRFQELCVEQEFAGKVRAVGRDPLHSPEPLLTLDLVDTSTAVDIYLNQVLVSEGRAQLTDP